MAQAGNRANQHKFIYELPYEPKKHLCNLLDMYNQWELLAGKHMEYSDLELGEIRRAERRGDSPTERLLQCWGQQNKTIKELYLYLYRMKHYQAMTVLLPFIDKKHHKLAKNDDYCLTEIISNVNHRNSNASLTSSTVSIGNLSQTLSDVAALQQRSRIMVAGGLRREEGATETLSQNTNQNLVNPSTTYSTSSAQGPVSVISNTIVQNLNINDDPGPISNKLPPELLVFNNNSAACVSENVDGRNNSPKLQGQSANGDKIVGSVANLNTQNGAQSTSSRQNNHEIRNHSANNNGNIGIVSEEDNIAVSDIPTEKTGAIMKTKKNSKSSQAQQVNDLNHVTEKIINIPGSDKQHSIKSDGTGIQNTNASSLPSPLSSDQLEGTCITKIPYKEILEATEGWNNEFLIGKGGFGLVYKGTWKNTEVAIKKIKDEQKERQNDAIKKEINLLPRYQHDNILQTFGYSFEEESPICIIYQFMANGTVEDKLQCRKVKVIQNVMQYQQPLTWIQRLNIAYGTAAAIQFLHSVRTRPLIHGDIKTANILLDINFVPKLGDFGFAKEGPMLPKTSTKVSKLQGTNAYLPEEYFRNFQLSKEVDCYAYGICMFELMSGLRASDEHRKPINIKDFVKRAPSIESLKDKKADPNPCSIFYLLYDIGKTCVATKHSRPKMSDVHQYIQDFKNFKSDGMSTPDSSHGSKNMKGFIHTGSTIYQGSSIVGLSPNHPHVTQVPPNINMQYNQYLPNPQQHAHHFNLPRAQIERIPATVANFNSPVQGGYSPVYHVPRSDVKSGETSTTSVKPNLLPENNAESLVLDDSEQDPITVKVGSVEQTIPRCLMFGNDYYNDNTSPSVHSTQGTSVEVSAQGKKSVYDM